jgi:hypothetical protein
MADGLEVPLYADCSCVPWTGLSELSMSRTTCCEGDRVEACCISAVLRRASP